MFRAREGARPRWPTILACLVLGLGAMGSGCSTMSGLRSIGTTDRPSSSRLGFWEGPQPAADPAADYYARYMHEARDRSEALAKRSADASRRARDVGASSPDLSDEEQLASNENEADAAGSRPRRLTEPVRDETVHVTLGAPEPLPALAGTMDNYLAWTASPTRSSDDPQPQPEPQPRPRAHPVDADRSADSVSAPRLALQQPAANRLDPADRADASEPTARPAPPPRRPTRRESPDGKAILAQSAAKLRSLDTYQVRIERTERVGGQLQPEEKILMSIRRDPKAVRLEWADDPNKGREVIYATNVDPRSLFVHMPKTAISLPRMKLSIDSPLIMKKSRHSIAEAGLDTIIENLQRSVDGPDVKSLGRLAYRGIEKPPGLNNRPSHVFTRRSPSGDTWTVFLDARTLLPCLAVAKDAKGDLDERYVYHEVQENPTELAAADAFDPDRRWGESNGLLSRFARAAMGSDSTTSRQSTTR